MQFPVVMDCKRGYKFDDISNFTKYLNIQTVYLEVLSLNQSTKKKAACSDLLSCLYSLNEIDYKIFYSLNDREDKSLDQIASDVKRNRTTVYKNLQKLSSLGLVKKEMKCIESGGQYLVFRSLEAQELRKVLETKVKETKDNLDAMLKKFSEYY
jgi:predicted transcriptional regulator